MIAVNNTNISAIKALPWDTIKMLFPKAYMQVIGQVWVREWIRHNKETGETFVKGHWETETCPGHATDIVTAVTMARRYTKYEIVRVIPEIEFPQSFHNVIMSDR